MKRLGFFLAGLVVVGLVILIGQALSAIEPTVPTARVHKAPFKVRVTAEGNISAATSTPLTVPISPQIPFDLAWIVEDGTQVKAGDLIARFDPSQLEKDRDDGRSDQRISDFKISSAEVRQEVTRSNRGLDRGVAQHELEVAREFQATDVVLYSKLDIAESAIDTELAEKKARHADDSQEIQQELSEAEIELLAIERRKADIKVSQAEEGLDGLEVRSPYAGVVMIERNWRGDPVQVGDRVWPGRTLAKIPDLDQMQAEVYVLEADAGDLKPGQQATVWLESRPDQPFIGELESVDPMAGRKHRWKPVQYFRTSIALADTVPEVMKPGARVRTEITIADLDEAITVPRQAVCFDQGQTIVYRWEGRDFEPVTVELGPAALGRIVIETGLADGDLIALRDPTAEAGADGGATSDKGPTVPGGAS